MVQPSFTAYLSENLEKLNDSIVPISTSRLTALSRVLNFKMRNSYIPRASCPTTPAETYYFTFNTFNYLSC